MGTIWQYICTFDPKIDPYTHGSYNTYWYAYLKNIGLIRYSFFALRTRLFTITVWLKRLKPQYGLTNKIIEISRGIPRFSNKHNIAK